MTLLQENSSSSTLLKWTFVCLTVLYLLVQLVRKFKARQAFIEQVDQVPGPKASRWNPLGNVAQMRTGHKVNPVLQSFVAMNRFIAQYGNRHSLIRYWVGGHPNYIFYRAHSAEKIFSSTLHIRKSAEYRFLHKWLGTGLLTSWGEKWFHRRKMLTPAFHFNILEAFSPIMNEQANVLVGKIKNFLNTQTEQNGTVIDVSPLVTNAALDIICETAMGAKINAQSNPNSDYCQAICRISNTILQRFSNPLYWNDFIYYNFTSPGRQDKADLATLHNFTLKVIRERTEAKRKTLVDSYKKESSDNSVIETRRRLAFLDLLIEHHLSDPKSMTEFDMREEVDTFMFEGHDTTTVSMIWTLFFLGHNPEIQTRVHQELDDLWEREAIDQSLNSKQLKELKYLEACIKESLRLMPSVPVIIRVAEEDIHYEHYTIPKGSSMFLYISMIQRDPAQFSNPNEFIPERFLDNSSEASHKQHKPNPYAYVPFSAGNRNCIGQKFALQEEKIVLAFVLRHFRLESVKQLDDIVMYPELVMRHQEPIDIRFFARN